MSTGVVCVNQAKPLSIKLKLTRTMYTSAVVSYTVLIHASEAHNVHSPDAEHPSSQSSLPQDSRESLYTWAARSSSLPSSSSLQRSRRKPIPTRLRPQ